MVTRAEFFGQSNVDYASLERRWTVAAHRLHQEAQQDPATREVLADYIGASLHEELASEVMDQAASVNERLRGQAADPQLGPFLQGPPVPVSLLVPDAATAFRKAQKYRDPDGISHAQFEGLTRRYRFGRDLKLLSLAALLQTAIPESTFLPNGDIACQLGEVKLRIAAEHVEEVPTLLDPTNWHERRQLKDRVHRTRIGKREYILKERKTAQHTDLKKDGHVRGASS